MLTAFQLQHIRDSRFTCETINVNRTCMCSYYRSIDALAKLSIILIEGQSGYIWYENLGLILATVVQANARINCCL